MQILGRLIISLALVSQSARTIAVAVPPGPTGASRHLGKALWKDGATKVNALVNRKLETAGLSGQQPTLPQPTPSPSPSPSPRLPGKGDNSPGAQAVNPSSTPGGQAVNPSSAPGSTAGSGEGMPSAPARISASATCSNETSVHVRLGEDLNSAEAKKGEEWTGTLANNICVDGQIVARAGDKVTGKVTSVKASKGANSPGQLKLRLVSVNDQPISSSKYKHKGQRYGAADGMIGGLVGGGKGTAVGSVNGGAAGAGSSAAVGAAADTSAEARLSAETELTFVVKKKAWSRVKDKQQKPIPK